MNVLILGGTLFLGRHLAACALEAGHAVTLFHRGRTNPDLFPQARHLLGDRKADLSALEDGSWDVVIDTSGYEPEAVDASARALVDRVGQYVFISTISVYAEPVTAGADENAPLATLEAGAERTLSGATYGALKVECEGRVTAHYGARGLIIRPGLIVGPHDPTDRFTYWPVRLARGGDVVVPHALRAPIQWIDVRDLAEWTLRLIEGRVAGVFNATGPADSVGLSDFLDACRTAVGVQSQFVELAESFLLEYEVKPFLDLPFWLPQENAGLLAVDIRRALDAGLTFRDLATTVHDTLTWRTPTLEETPLRAGLAPAREAELLAAWAARV